MLFTLAHLLYGSWNPTADKTTHEKARYSDEILPEDHIDYARDPGISLQL